MKIITYTSLRDFEAWSGALPTLRRLIDEDLTDQLESILDELFPDGMTDTELNNLLWFEDETIFAEWLGVDTEESIRKEIEELEELMEENEEYRDDDRIERIKEEIEELKKRKEEIASYYVCVSRKHDKQKKVVRKLRISLL